MPPSVAYRTAKQSGAKQSQVYRAQQPSIAEYRIDKHCRTDLSLLSIARIA